MPTCFPRARSARTWPAAVLTVAEKSCSFSPYCAPAETVPPAAGKNLRIDVASPALPASSRHNGTIPVIRCRRSSATIAAPSLRSSGTSRNTLSPASASEDAVEPGLITISPTLSATVRTAAISELFSGPTATWTPSLANSSTAATDFAASPATSMIFSCTRVDEPAFASRAFAFAAASSSVTLLDSPRLVHPAERSRIAPTTTVLSLPTARVCAPELPAAAVTMSAVTATATTRRRLADIPLPPDPVLCPHDPRGPQRVSQGLRWVTRVAAVAARRDWTRETLAAAVREGDRRALARAITLVEKRDALAHDVVADPFPKTGKTYSGGLTGAPGGGESGPIP